LNLNKNLLKHYLEELGIQKQKLSLAFVQEIQQKHLAHFSFNSIAVLLGKEISLEIENIVEKIVIQKKGGYCFEHNALMYEVLKALGFDVRLLVGKVTLNQEIDVPRTHRITLLRFEHDEYLIDVGFGAYCPTFPIKVSSSTEYDTYRLTQNEDEDYELQVPTTDGYFTLYRFNLSRYTQADCVMGNFYSSNYKDAVFMNNLVVSLIFEDGVLSLRNRTYHKTFGDKKELIQITSYKQLHGILESDFFLRMDEEEVEKIFVRLAE